MVKITISILVLLYAVMLAGELKYSSIPALKEAKFKETPGLYIYRLTMVVSQAIVGALCIGMLYLIHEL